MPASRLPLKADNKFQEYKTNFHPAAERGNNKAPRGVQNRTGITAAHHETPAEPPTQAQGTATILGDNKTAYSVQNRTGDTATHHGSPEESPTQAQGTATILGDNKTAYSVQNRTGDTATHHGSPEEPPTQVRGRAAMGRRPEGLPSGERQKNARSGKSLLFIRRAFSVFRAAPASLCDTQT